MKHIVLLLFFLIWPAAASENLVSGLSQDTIEIRSNYNGAEITVFGAVEHPDTAKPDIVVVVRGPEVNMRVMRKDHVAGLWINRDRVLLGAMPSYYFVAANRPLAGIAPVATRRQYALGLDALRPASIKADDDPKPFQQALLAQMQRAGLYLQAEDAVEFLSGTLFRVRVPVPSSAPRGTYVAEVYLLRDGHVIDVRSSELVIDQIGLERRIFDFSKVDPFAYGLSTVLMAMLFGWLSSLAFRRTE